MTRYVVYINEQKIDLPPKTVIPITYQLGDLKTLKARKVSYAAQFGAPKTQTNKQIFGFADQEESATDVPYVKLPCRIESGGLDILIGSATVNDSTKTYNIEIYSNTFDFFDSLGTRSIQELDTFADDPWSGSGLLKKPVIDYGDFLDYLQPLQFKPTDYWCLPYSYLIDQIIKQNGYAKSGSIFSDSKYSKLHLAGLGYGNGNDKWSAGKEFSAFRDTSVVFNAFPGQVMNFTDVEYNGGFYDGTNTWQVVDTVYGGAYFYFNAYAKITINSISFAGGADHLQLQLFAAGQAFKLTGITGPGTYYLEVSDSAGFDSDGVQMHRAVGQDGAFIQVVATTYALIGGPVGTATITLGESHLYNKVILDKSINATLPTVSIQNTLPDVKMKDLMGDFAVRFGVLFDQKNGELKVKRMEDIISDRASAVDWTSKRVNKKNDPVAYAFQDFAQVNWFRYGDPDGLRKDLYDAHLDVFNQNLPAEQEYYLSIFNKSYTVPRGNLSEGYITMARIPVQEWVDIDVSNIHDACVVDTIENVPLSGLSLKIASSLYGTGDINYVTVTLVTDQRIAVRYQDDKTKNGIWLAKSGAWVRASDFASVGDADNATVEIIETRFASPGFTIPSIASRPKFLGFPEVHPGAAIGSFPVNWVELYSRDPTIKAQQRKQTTEPGLRLVLVRSKRVEEPTLSGGVSSYSVAYFDDPFEDDTLDFQQTLDRDYAGLINAMRRTKLVTHSYMLTQADVAGLDLFKLIADNGSYYMINRVKEFIPGMATEVELLKV